MLATLCHGWDVALKPVPKLTSVDLDGTFFFAPLAYLAATLLTALYFGQVWLFTMSAFGVVWLDSQMAWRAQQVRGRSPCPCRQRPLERRLTFPPPCADRSGDDAEAHRGTSRDRLHRQPVQPPPRRRREIPSGAECSRHHRRGNLGSGLNLILLEIKHADCQNQVEPEIDSEEAAAETEELPAPIAAVADVPQAVAAVPEAPRAVAEPEPEPEPEVSLPAEAEAAVPVQPVVAGAVEEENEESLYDDTFILMAEMEAVRRELAQALDARKQERALKQAMAAAAVPAVVATEDRGPPPQLPPRPPPIELEEIPALPETDEDDTALHVFSMEQLEESTSSQSSLRSFGDFVEAAGGQEFSRPPSRLVNKEAPHFPIIDDVLKDFEASIQPIEMQPSLSAIGSDATDEHYEHDSGHSSEHGDSRNDSSCDENESRPDSPATSVSSSNDDDADVKVEPLDFARPALVHVDSGISMAVEEEAVEVEDVKEEANTIAAAILGALEIPTDEKTAMTVLQTELPIAEEEQTIEAPIEAIELPTKTVAPVLQRPGLVRTSASRPSRKKTVSPRKNNGHKHIPKKVRLSASEKQKFLSRPAW